ncbi:MAG: hypothetical protein KJ607_00110 [Bacteroidetes bacterium]|nr:hypothetical protein [Bacteroidota bacterium]
MKSKRQTLILMILASSLAGISYAKNYIPDKNSGDEGNDKSLKSISAGCIPASASTELDLNNVRALIHTGGDMWWDLMNAPRYEVPRGSGKHALFCGSIWIGGTDVNGQLRLCAVMHRTYGVDYWPGPLITKGSQRANVTADVCAEYDKHFVITKEEVSKFRAWYNADIETKEQDYAGYTVPEIIQEWPAHGNVSEGYDFYLAPFEDVNADGYYNFNDGDYPRYDLDQKYDCGTSIENRHVRLYGDKTLWWVYNDKGNIHTETDGAAIGMEIRAQAFAFATNDELNNMTFGNYEIINRSTYTLENCYFGVWTDADLGDFEDDYVGCDVRRGLGYLYNSDNNDGDGNGRTYGENPPAIGIDFFEGPYQDIDFKDNLSSWTESGNQGQLDCNWGYGTLNAQGEPDKDGVYQQVGPVDLEEGNINGLNFGDGRVDNERWGMRRFIYFFNPSYQSPPSYAGDPSTAVEYYYYLRGYWKDGTRMIYGGLGHGTTGANADFMFPWDPYGTENTDPCGWGTEGTPQTDPWSEPLENALAGDMRFVQSAGPFTLKPGMVNDVTVGVVWARSSEGYRESVSEVRRADEKAQRLFENCFQVVDGPDSPEMTPIALDREIIFHLWNKETPLSNNYKEGYLQKDPFIICPLDEDGYTTSCDIYFRFQGYQVFQMATKDASISDIRDVTKARQIFQCDVKDGVAQLVNLTWSDQLGANVPEEMVNGADLGIRHTFRITEDQFATDDKRLINNKKYYFIAIAYAYNNYKTYDQNDGSSLDGQKEPYKAGRKASEGASIRAVTVIPHKVEPLYNGTILNSEYGDGVEITRIEGLGTGHNYIKITDETHDAIMSGAPWKAETVEYQPGYGPIQIKVVDPLNVIEEDFILRFNPHPDSITAFTSPWNGFITYSSWVAYKASEDAQFYLDTVPDMTGADSVIINYPPSSVFADRSFLYNNEQLIPEWGISIKVVQVDVPMMANNLDVIVGSDRINDYITDNGFVGADVIFQDENRYWLAGIPDDDDCSAWDWIRAGTQKNDDDPQCNDYYASEDFFDRYEVYEDILAGTWAPCILGAKDRYDIHPFLDGVTLQAGSNISLSVIRLSSIDVYITKDSTKWTRCPVIETCNNDTTEDETNHQFYAGPSGVLKYDLRNAQSINRRGVSAPVGSGKDSLNVTATNYIAEKSMGWFPGYAIDVETGERLNMMYGEDSWQKDQNGDDMLWNPTNRYATLGKMIFGGKHFLYIFGHNFDHTHDKYMPAYDAGRYIYEMLSPDTIAPPYDTIGCGHYGMQKTRKPFIYQNAMWMSIPILNDTIPFKSYDEIPCDIKVELRIATPYWLAKKDYEIENPRNYNFPMFSFSTTGLAPTKNDAATAENALEMVKIVPNPYYGHNSYEESQLDYKVKFTNLPESCTISIFSVNGTLIRRIVKDNELTIEEWNMKNEYGILIASGVYIIHVDAPGIGEKVLKWMVAVRQMDMNNF